jgi:hypothetical protein
VTKFIRPGFAGSVDGHLLAMQVAVHPYMEDKESPLLWGNSVSSHVNRVDLVLRGSIPSK